METNDKIIELLKLKQENSIRFALLLLSFLPDSDIDYIMCKFVQIVYDEPENNKAYCYYYESDIIRIRKNKIQENIIFIMEKNESGPYLDIEIDSKKICKIKYYRNHTNNEQHNRLSIKYFYKKTYI